jgi:hypothetical protein
MPKGIFAPMLGTIGYGVDNNLVTGVHVMPSAVGHRKGMCFALSAFPFVLSCIAAIKAY